MEKWLAGGVSNLREEHGKGKGDVHSGEQQRMRVDMYDIMHNNAGDLPLQQKLLCYWSPFLYLPGKYLLLLLLISSCTLTALSSVVNLNITDLKSLWDNVRCFGDHHHIRSAHLLFLSTIAEGSVHMSETYILNQLCFLASLYFSVSELLQNSESASSHMQGQPEV